MSDMPAGSHITALDHILAANRNECGYIHDEEIWEAKGAYPTLVLRRYAREDVFRRDRGRMLALRYRVLSIDKGSSQDTSPELRVTYQRLDDGQVPR